MAFPYRATRRGRVPSGPIVVAINHLSHVDPPIAGLAIRRPTRFLALDELWGNAWILDRLFRVFGAIPLPRTGRRPVAAIRAALRELERGGSVGVFPEGRRVQVWGDAELKRGAAWLSVRTGDIVDIREVRASERRLKASQLFENDPANGKAPRIVIRPPQLEDAESLAAARGGTLRGQSPDEVTLDIYLPVATPETRTPRPHGR